MPDERQNPIPAVAGIILQNGKILLIKRAFEPSKGKWSVPGGSVEWGESLEAALEREVREETGLEVEIAGIAGVFDLVFRDSQTSEISFHYVIVDYFAHVVGGELSPGDDASEAEWVDLQELDKYEMSDHLYERLTGMGVLGNQ